MGRGGKSLTGRKKRKALLFGIAAFGVGIAAPYAAYAQQQTFTFDIPNQPMSAALLTLGRQAGISILASTSLVEGKRAPDIRGEMTVQVALDRMLAGSGLSAEFVSASAVRIVAARRLEAPRKTSAPSSSPVEPDTVVVTGSNIRGVRPVASPIDSYSQQDIERSGATTTEQFVGKLPQNLGTLSQYAVGAMLGQPNLDSVTAIDLRGLGVGTTLTLLNGHRMALSNSGQSADVSFIPASAIERVDVLTDGASAIYGSDAIGGVVNFVLRKDFDGAESRVSHGGATDGGMRQTDLSQTFGRSWADGQGVAAYNYHAASALKRTERDYAVAAGPGTLTPVDTQHSIIGAATQDLSDRVHLAFDGGAGWKKVKNFYSDLTSASQSARTRTRYTSQTDQAFATVGLTYDISDTMTADVTGSWAKLDTTGEAELVRINTPTQVFSRVDTSSWNSQLDLSAKLQGSLFELPAGPLKFTVGGGLLKERFQGVGAIQRKQSIGILGRESPYAFGELYALLVNPSMQIPMVHSLSLSVAGRYTDYRDKSSPALARDFGDSTDPKIGVSWSPVQPIVIRATYGTSFRAPSLTQLDMTGASHFLLPQTVAGSPSILLVPSAYSVKDLGPETARIFAGGFDYAPAFGLRFSATYYNIDYTDRIAQAPAGGLNPFATPDRLPDLIYRPPSAAYVEQLLAETPLSQNLTTINVSDPAAGAAALYARNDVWIYDTRLRNLAVSKQDGLDLKVSQSVATPVGDLNAGITASHILHYKQQGSSASAVLPASDIPGGPADWRGRAQLSLSRGGFNGSFGVNYVDDYINPAAPTGAQHIASWTTVDANLTYRFSGENSRTGPRLSLSVQNLFGRNPPYLRTGAGSNISAPVGFDPANSNPIGRFVVLGFTQAW